MEKTIAETRAAVAPMKYGDEKALLSTTTTVMESLYLWLTGTNFDLQENRSLKRKQAEDLWNNCTFTISR